MNKNQPILCVILPLLMSGCVFNPTQNDLSTLSPAPVTERSDVETEIRRLRAQAKMLRAAGRYAESVQKLDHALAIRPNDAKLRNEWLAADKEWRTLDQTLNDQLLSMETQTRRKRLPLMEKLARANPRDLAVQQQLTTLKQQLENSAPLLSACGERHLKTDPKLARQCLQLALAEREQAEDRARYTSLTPKAKAAPKNARKKTPRKPKSVSTTPAESTVKLTKARELMKSGNHFGAIRYLEKLRLKDSSSIELLALLDQAKANLERDTEKFLAAGDSLYQEGKVKEALALWQVALSINPYNLPARKKSERALRVLANMRTLKEEHNPARKKSM